VLRHWCASTGIFERALAGTRTQAPQADAAREVEAFDHVCDQVASETADEKIAIETFARLLGAGLGTLKLGKTPTGLDRVTIAEVQRSRVGEVKRAIVGGLCARDFPRSAAAGRFFNESERTLLSRLGLDLGTPAPMRQEEEGYFLYVALTRAREALLMTRPTLDLEGKPLEASPFVQEIRAALPGLTEETPALEESPADLHDAQTYEEIAARVGAYIASRLDRRRAGRAADPEPARASRDDQRILTAYNRLIIPESPGRRFLRESSRLWGYDNRPVLPRAVIAAALGEGGGIATSAGRLETYAQCAYRHFARHLLRLEERPRSEVTPLENGLLAHRALEVLYSEGVPPAERRTIRERLEDVFSRIEGDVRLKAYQVDPSGGFRWRNARGQLRRFLEIEAKRLARSGFRPYLFEQEFGTEDVPPLRIPLPMGGEVFLRGRIDRIDILEPRGEGRPEALVIDYKSRIAPGRGRPALVEDGLDLQLAVYMIVAAEILDLDPIGALYAPVLPRPKANRSKDPENPLDIRMVGLLPESERERVTGGVAIIQGAQRKLRDKGELQGVIEKAREMIISHASGIMDGRIDVAPVRVGRLPCDHCEFAGLCRVDRSYNPSVAPPSRRR
jgi:ATP-dependent helicase/nuclease subunit B